MYSDTCLVWPSMGKQNPSLHETLSVPHGWAIVAYAFPSELRTLLGKLQRTSSGHKIGSFLGQATYKLVVFRDRLILHRMLYAGIFQSWSFRASYCWIQVVTETNLTVHEKKKKSINCTLFPLKIPLSQGVSLTPPSPHKPIPYQKKLGKW